MTQLKVILLGTPMVFINNHQVSFRLSKEAGLFFYCFLSETPLSRDFLNNLFFPNERNRRPLNNLIYHLKKDFEKAGASDNLLAGLNTSSDIAFEFPPSLVSCDVAQISEATEQFRHQAISLSALESAVNEYRGDFLGTFSLPDVDPSFENWVSQQHSHYEACFQELLQALCVRLIATEQYGEALIYLDRLLNLDDESQEPYGLRMVCYTMLGQSRHLDKTFQEYVQMMENSFGMEPSTTMTKLRESLMRFPLHTTELRNLLHSFNSQDEPNLHEQFTAILSALGIRLEPQFTPAVRGLLSAAQEIAKDMQVPVVGTSHVLMAIAKSSDREVVALRQGLQVEWRSLSAETHRILFAVDPIQPTNGAPRLSLSLALKQAIQTAHHLSASQPNGGLTIQTLWQGLISQPQSFSAEFWQQFSHRLY